jgi:hypothetical protein
LLAGDERRRLFELAIDDREVARHYKLSADDLKWIDARHGPANQLGAAVQLARDLACAPMWPDRRGVDGWAAGSPHRVSVTRHVGAHGLRRARRRVADDLRAHISSEQLARVDKLLVSDPDLKMTPLAWLRDIRSRQVRPAWQRSLITWHMSA